MRQLAAALAATVASAVVFASAAYASKPDRFPVLNGPFTISGSCTFDVQGEPIHANETVMVLTNPQGTEFIITGALTVRLTNVATGKSIVVNASGPGFFTDTSARLTGLTLLAMQGSPVLLVRGPLTFDENGNAVFTSASSVDLCAVLADP
jgi:hypothetical protein